jgi:hypothetical protein
VLGEKYFGLAPLIAGEGAADWTSRRRRRPAPLGADRAVTPPPRMRRMPATTWSISHRYHLRR